MVDLGCFRGAVRDAFCRYDERNGLDAGNGVPVICRNVPCFRGPDVWRCVCQNAKFPVFLYSTFNDGACEPGIE